MNAPKLHHYVPQFYLKRFVADKGRFYVWDKTNDRIFATQPKAIAAETDFYWLHEFERQDHDPLTMEKQFADLEGQVSLITAQWLAWIYQASPRTKISIPKENREIIARYIALQFLRTADTKDILCSLHELDHPNEALTTEKRTELHAMLLWDLNKLGTIERHIKDAIWIFGRNESNTPFWTSDNPVAFKTANNRMWLKAGFISRGTYVVFPLSPTVVMYCHERDYWKKMTNWDCIVSPVDFTDEMVQHENAGQVFMATRFIISSTNDFRFGREFLPSIGTDQYASDEWDAGLPDPRFLLGKKRGRGSTTMKNAKSTMKKGVPKDGK